MKTTWFFLCFCSSLASAVAQDFTPLRNQPEGTLRISAWDTAIARLCPVMKLPSHLCDRTLPPVVDNSQTIHWPGIHEQNYYTCQQYAGVVYGFGYEINRLRQQSGVPPENHYSAHYTWNFMNYGESYQGVSFFQSWEAIRQLGHMTVDQYGPDSAYQQYGWVSGYDKYYSGMSNRIKNVWSIPINSEEGVNALKNLLYDRMGQGTPGSVATLTISSNGFYNLPFLPEGTPEEGKAVVVEWLPHPIHGITIVGYNDSIRYDINGDGQYTNDIDITNDQVVDIRDWEIGGFRFANSYGTWWQDQGYAYVLYRAMAMDYEAGGVWNNSVYVIEPDESYQPKLTMRATLRHNRRDLIRVLAGVSTDTMHQIPDHIIHFPILNFQGGIHPMIGFDSLTESDTLEFGLDVTPLLNFVTPGEKAKFFLGVEEQDPLGQGSGCIRRMSFIDYANGGVVFAGPADETQLRNNATTFISATGTLNFQPVQITTATLPSYDPGVPYETQLYAAEGRAPYQWSLDRTYRKTECEKNFQLIGGVGMSPVGEYQPFTPLDLPFEFPFFGKNYNTIYVNRYGFITFEPIAFPVPYTTDEEAMLRPVAAISPGFSIRYKSDNPIGCGPWAKITSDSIIVRWKCDVDGYQNLSENNFEVVLLRNGNIIFQYDSIRNEGFTLPVVTGLSAGDRLNYDLTTILDFNNLAHQSICYSPRLLPPVIGITGAGLLTVAGADTNRILDIPVRVTDADGLSDSKEIPFSSGIQIAHQFVSDQDNRIEYDKPAWIDLVIINTSLTTYDTLNLKLVLADSAIQIPDSLEIVTQLLPGATKTVEHAFTLYATKMVEDGYTFQATLMAVTSERQWIKEITGTVSAVELVFMPVKVIDGQNQFLERGEVADLRFTVTNEGSIAGNDFSVVLSSHDPMLEILSDTILPMQRFYPKTEALFSFTVKADRNTPWGYGVPMELCIRNEEGLTFLYPFTLILGNKPLALLDLTAASPSAEAMRIALDSLEVPYDLLTAIPQSPTHGSLFIFLGSANQQAHDLTIDEGGLLANFLDHSGKIYMESYSTWYYRNDTPVHPMFKYTAEKVTKYYYNQVTGVPGTFSESMDFRYDSEVNYALFTIFPRGGSFVSMTNGPEEPMNLQIAYDGDDYKTIASLVEFTALIDTTEPSSKLTLMKRYLDFFGIFVDGPWPYFHADATTVCQGTPVTFYDDSFDNILTRSWEFPGGIPAFSTEAEPVVTYPEKGLYTVALTVSDGVNTHSIMKKEYITAYNCAGVDGSPGELSVRIFPNPVNDRLTLVPERPLFEPVTVMITDLTGRPVLSRKLPDMESGHTFDLSSLSPGLYLLSLHTKSAMLTVKIIVN